MLPHPTEVAPNSRVEDGFLRWVLIALVAVVVILQYQLWLGPGGRLELQQLRQQAADYERENALLLARNAELAKQVLDLKSGETVLEQRAREELGLTSESEVFYQFVEPDGEQAPNEPTEP